MSGGTDYGRMERIAFQAESYVLVIDGEHINVGAVIRALYTDHRRLALDAKKIARLVEAGKALQADMLERARIGRDAIHGEEYRIVNAGRTAWADFCAAITEAGQ